MIQQTILRRCQKNALPYGTAGKTVFGTNRPLHCGVITRWFPQRLFGIITDAADRDYFYLAAPHHHDHNDHANQNNHPTSSSTFASSSSSLNSHHPVGRETDAASSTVVGGVGARVVFRVEPNHRHPGRMMAVDVAPEPPHHQEELVGRVLDTMGDPQWEKVVTVREATQSLWVREHREEAAKWRRRSGGGFSATYPLDDSTAGAGNSAANRDAWFPVRHEDLVQRVEALHVFEQLTHPIHQCRLDAQRIDVFSQD